MPMLENQRNINPDLLDLLEFEKELEKEKEKPKDPRILPCKDGDTVVWKGVDYVCRIKLEGGSRPVSFWRNVREEQKQAERDREKRRDLNAIEKIVQAVLLGLFSSLLAVNILPHIAPLIDKISLLTTQTTKLIGDFTRLTPVFERAEAEYNRVKGMLDTAGIATSVRALKTIHRIASLTSETYRAKIDQWTREVGRLGSQVFGRAQTLNSALSLLQMAIYDSAALQGRSLEQAQSAYLDRAVALTERVESNARRYAQTPYLFWADLNRLYLDPVLAERVALGANAAGVVSRIDRGLESLTEASTALTERFTDYQAELEPFLSREKLEEIDTIRRGFNDRVLFPLQEIDTWFREIWPEQAEVIIGTVETVEFLEEEVADLQGLVPVSLDQAAAVAQKRRRVWTEILGDTLTPSSEFPTPLPPVSARVESAYKRLLGD